jgi:hypothetical protein
MRIIKLTNIYHTPHTTVYINIECIGHISEIPNKIEYGKISEPAHTVLGVTTHNNNYLGGFKIKETAEEILKLIEASKGI